MSEKRFVCIDIGYGDDWYITDNGKRLSEMEIVDLLNEQQATISALKNENDILKQKLRKNYIANKQYEEMKRLQKENERLRNQLERKTILLKIRTKHMDDRDKSFHELLNYLESFCYKSNIDGNYAKQDIINILNNWEIREYD